MKLRVLNFPTDNHQKFNQRIELEETFNMIKIENTIAFHRVKIEQVKFYNPGSQFKRKEIAFHVFKI